MPPTSDALLHRRFENTARLVDNCMNGIIPDDGSRLRSAMRYAVLGPGKKLRPLLVIESASLFGTRSGDPVRVGAALECVHCYSLVHDDLPAMDNDDLRRGQPTLHRKFDEATAILAGDALLTLAFEILSHPRTHPEPLVRSQLVLALAQAAGEAGMVGGQMLDIKAETQDFQSTKQIAAMQTKKTGALFRFACESGAIAAQEDPQPLRQYADHLGLAFQIADDILDVESDAQTLGKATQKDKSKGKATFVDLMGLDAAKTEALRLSDLAIASLTDYGDHANILKAVARFVVSRQR